MSSEHDPASRPASGGGAQEDEPDATERQGDATTADPTSPRHPDTDDEQEKKGSAS
jgi:hypothetical protein